MGLSGVIFEALSPKIGRQRMAKQWEVIGSTHGNHFFCGRETAVVSHDTANQPCSQKHVDPLKQYNLGTLLGSRTSGCTTRPSTSDNDDSHGKRPSFLGFYNRLPVIIEWNRNLILRFACLDAPPVTLPLKQATSVKIYHYQIQ